MLILVLVRLQLTLLVLVLKAETRLGALVAFLTSMNLKTLVLCTWLSPWTTSENDRSSLVELDSVAGVSLLLSSFDSISRLLSLAIFLVFLF